MKWRGLDTYNQATEDSEKERVMRVNFERLGNIISKSGVNILTSITKDDTRTYNTSSAWIDLPDFSASVTCSGGVIDILANINLYTDGVDCWLAIIVNGKEKVTKRILGSNMWTVVPLNWVETLPAGQTVIKIVIASAGNVSVNTNSTPATSSELIVKEYLF